MGSTPIPPSLDQLAGRTFAFYPALLGVAHNEWRFEKATWSEILVTNTQTGAEVWIPRRFVGEVSRTDDPILIVGLNRDLEIKSGMVVAHQRRVISMPVAAEVTAATSTTAPGQGEPKPVSILRLDKSDRRVVRLIAWLVAAGLVVGLLVLNSSRIGEVRQRFTFAGSDRSFDNLSSHDDYLEVTRKLGPPTTDHPHETGTILYRALGYPERKYTVILMGRDQGSMVYIGTVDQDWRPIHFVNQHTASLLRTLKPF
ncbi:MAG: hypothetical protein ABSH40_11475 [Bryobacteraceae bacterium]|jgi:hypothetical protein